MDSTEKKAVIAEHFRKIMETLGLDLEDESLVKTPDRVAKMYVDEWFYGLSHEKFPRMMTLENDDSVSYNQMLVERNIKVHSTCEHHFCPIVGVAHVAYIPQSKVVGLSKLNRVVDYFSRRPQVQERLTEDIHKALREHLQTEDVAVIVDARHFCVITRGVMDVNSSTVTSKLSGAFNKPEARQELMDLIKNPSKL